MITHLHAPTCKDCYRHLDILNLALIIALDSEIGVVGAMRHTLIWSYCRGHPPPSPPNNCSGHSPVVVMMVDPWNKINFRVLQNLFMHILTIIILTRLESRNTVSITKRLHLKILKWTDLHTESIGPNSRGVYSHRCCTNILVPGQDSWLPPWLLDLTQTWQLSALPACVQILTTPLLGAAFPL